MGTSVMGVGSTSVAPMNYAVENQSVPSTSFTERLQAMQGVNGVAPSSPVQYANATIKTEADKMQENIDMSAAYNDIASAFAGYSTSYNQNSIASSYSMVGANFDSIA